jgi:hypothetical protein
LTQLYKHGLSNAIGLMVLIHNTVPHHHGIRDVCFCPFFEHSSDQGAEQDGEPHHHDCPDDHLPDDCQMKVSDPSDSKKSFFCYPLLFSTAVVNIILPVFQEVKAVFRTFQQPYIPSPYFRICSLRAPPLYA